MQKNWVCANMMRGHWISFSYVKIIPEVPTRENVRSFMQIRKTQTDNETDYKNMTLCIDFKIKHIQHDHQQNVLRHCGVLRRLLMLSGQMVLFFAPSVWLGVFIYPHNQTYAGFRSGDRKTYNPNLYLGLQWKFSVGTSWLQM